jgi:hypothetical protein
VYLNDSEKEAFEQVMKEGGSIPANSVAHDALTRAAFMRGVEWDNVSRYHYGTFVRFSERGGMKTIQLWQSFGTTVGGQFIRRLLAERFLDEEVRPTVEAV